MKNLPANPTKNSKKFLESVYYKCVPKARKINPFFRESFQIVYDAACASRGNKRVLNIFSSQDLSAEREKIFRKSFFNDADYSAVDFWEDSFVTDIHGKTSSLPFAPNSFDVILTTKILLEHTTKPQHIFDEFFRVLRPGGQLFLIAPHIRRQHQPPHDYYRFTEHALEHLLSTSKYSNYTINHAGGFMAVVGYYSYFFQRGLPIPKLVEKLLNFFTYHFVEPFCYSLDMIDNGYGRDFTLYFFVRATK